MGFIDGENCMFCHFTFRIAVDYGHIVACKTSLATRLRSRETQICHNECALLRIDLRNRGVDTSIEKLVNWL